ncbi:response regulator [Ferrovibrio terrae]|uniref:response regulator n=1 Tax=Ferrovibrio terrae TaxID=2594003 RepID=UPI0031382E83
MADNKEAAVAWWAELIRIVPGTLWPLIVIGILIFYRQPIIRTLGRLKAFEGLGIKLQLAEEEIKKAAEEKSQPFSSKIQNRLLNRLSLVGHSFKNARILWVDDHPENNMHEIEALKSLGVSVDLVQSSKDAVRELSAASLGYDLILSDMNRNGIPGEGIAFARKLSASSPLLIIYCGPQDAQKEIPRSVFGITEKPVELLHLVADALERRRL